ncbi:hypothetical protein F7725_016091, partial [Dissostichus mawsoni]
MGVCGVPQSITWWTRRRAKQRELCPNVATLATCVNAHRHYGPTQAIRLRVRRFGGRQGGPSFRVLDHPSDRVRQFYVIIPVLGTVAVRLQDRLSLTGSLLSVSFSELRHSLLQSVGVLLSALQLALLLVTPQLQTSALAT